MNSIFLLKMSSFKQVQDDLLICYCENIISDEEYFILSDLYRPNNLDLPYDEYPLFDLESMSNDECITEFRFEKSHLPLLADVLQIPPMFKCPQGSVADGMEALCMLLKRLSYPCRYADMLHRFGRPIPVLSMVTNQVLDFIYDTHGRRILQWNHDLLNPRSLEEYTYAVSRKGAPLMELSDQLHDREKTRGFSIMVTNVSMPSSFNLSHFLMALLRICLDRSVSTI